MTKAGQWIKKTCKAFGSFCRSFFDATFLKYIIVGLSTSAIGTGLMYLLYNAFGVSYWASSAANQIVAAVLVFFLNKRITFNVREWTVKLVFFYILNIAVCYVIGYGIARPIASAIFTNMGAVGQDNMAMWVGLLFYKILDYFGQRFFVFHKKLDRSHSTEESRA